MSRDAAMRTKLDENIGLRGASLLRSSGWDVETVVSQQLCSADDRTIIDVCQREDRTLISLDKDFSNTLRFPPARYSGIVVLRLPEPLTLATIVEALQRVVQLCSHLPVRGKLWIVDANRIREFTEPEMP